MPRSKDYTGMRSGKLVAVRPHAQKELGRWDWVFQCDCGGTVIRAGYFIAAAKRRGDASHCGCSNPSRTHGLTSGNRRLHWVWAAMVQRCVNPNNKDYPRYGGRGIGLCDEWRNDFGAFHAWAMATGYQEGLTIERVDVNDGYRPANCTWIDNSRQALNLEKSRRLTYQGRTQHISDWARETGICYSTIVARVFVHKWPIARALTEKPRWGKNQYG